MAVKKMRPKRHKGTVKRVKVTKGGDTNKGKLLINRINKGHRLIKKSRTRKLKAKTATTLGKTADKLRKVL